MLEPRPDEREWTRHEGREVAITLDSDQNDPTNGGTQIEAAMRRISSRRRFEFLGGAFRALRARSAPAR